jgi:hypothetical protein
MQSRNGIDIEWIMLKSNLDRALVENMVMDGNSIPVC